jgi:putative transposase
MARQLRIEFPGAIYHVTARGNGQADIFVDAEDRLAFLAVLAECITRFGWLCHAYCLMDNHYHLLIETPDGNLSSGMRQLNGVYTQRFNRRHGRVGHVFQGRFKAILVDRDSYLLELCRYVVLNPVRAKKVRSAARYKWSSYLATAGGASVPQWLQTDWVLSQFGKTRAAAKRRYERFVAEGVGGGSPWNELRGQVLLGGELFVSELLPLLDDKRKQNEIPRAQRWVDRPALKALFPARMKASKALRDAAIREAFALHRYSMADIARQACVHYSTVSRIIKGER